MDNEKPVMESAPETPASISIAEKLSPHFPPGVEVLGGKLYFRGVPVSEMQAYPLGVAQVLLGISQASLYRQIRLGKLKVTSLKLIPARELQRYLETDLALDP